MKPISFSNPKELVSYLKQSYLAKKHFLTIHVEHDFGSSPNGALKISKMNSLRIYDLELSKQSTDLLKMQVEVEKVLLTNELYNYLEKVLGIEVQYHRDKVDNFCHELTPLRENCKTSWLISTSRTQWGCFILGQMPHSPRYWGWDSERAN